MDCKIILLPQTKTTPINKKTKRMVTLHHSWKSNIHLDDQKKTIDELFLGIDDSETANTIKKQIHQKIMGYKYQDLNNKLFDEIKFVSFDKVIELLHLSKLTCFYCQSPVQILYDYVRESNQWTLERLDNHFGHNHDNLVISCLKCNLRRRTMYHERFLYTKQIGKQNVIKLP
jgi:hypothetical protein